VNPILAAAVLIVCALVLVSEFRRQLK